MLGRRRDRDARRASGCPSSRPALDLIAPVVGAIGAARGGAVRGGPYAARGARGCSSAPRSSASVTDAMLLGHWYLVQPGLRRDPVKELVRLTGDHLAVRVAVMLWPTGMVQVLNGTVDDG